MVSNRAITRSPSFDDQSRAWLPSGTLELLGCQLERNEPRGFQERECRGPGHDDPSEHCEEREYHQGQKLEDLRHVDCAQNTVARAWAMVIVKIADRHTHAEGQNEQQENRYPHPLIPARVHHSAPSVPWPVEQ